MYLITQTKQGISSIELGRRLGVTQTTAWKIKTKFAEVMRIAGESERLDGRIEMDDAYLGGERCGGKTGRGSPGKKPIVVAVQTSDDGRPRRIKLRRIARSELKQPHRALPPSRADQNRLATTHPPRVLFTSLACAFKNRSTRIDLHQRALRRLCLADA